MEVDDPFFENSYSRDPDLYPPLTEPCFIQSNNNTECSEYMAAPFPTGKSSVMSDDQDVASAGDENGVVEEALLVLVAEADEEDRLYDVAHVLPNRMEVEELPSVPNGSSSNRFSFNLPNAPNRDSSQADGSTSLFEQKPVLKTTCVAVIEGDISTSFSYRFSARVLEELRGDGVEAVINVYYWQVSLTGAFSARDRGGHHEPHNILLAPICLEKPFCCSTASFSNGSLFFEFHANKVQDHRANNHRSARKQAISTIPSSVEPPKSQRLAKAKAIAKIVTIHEEEEEERRKSPCQPLILQLTVQVGREIKAVSDPFVVSTKKKPALYDTMCLHALAEKRRSPSKIFPRNSSGLLRLQSSKDFLGTIPTSKIAWESYNLQERLNIDDTSDLYQV